MESTPAGVREAITFLCKGQGFNADRLATRQALVAVLGEPGTHPDILTERFVAAINSIGGPTAEILGDSLRLTERAWNLKTLKERRTLHGSLQDPVIGWEAVADRAETAIDHLVAVLVSGRYPKSPIPTRIAESHSGVAIYAMSVHTIVRDRRHEETRYRFQLVGLADGVDYFGVDTPSPNVPRLVSEDFSLQMKFYDYGYQHQFWPDEPMRHGKTYDLRYFIRNPHRGEEAVLTAEHMAFHEPTRFATFTVSFIGDKPKMIWRVNRLTGIATPGEPTRDTALSIDGQRTVRTEFSDLYGGLHSGIAWSWDA
ncbi:hypothetical protein BHE97_14570 [Aeromicrobium sp. PE09-221]|uniref:hypothetical protein n=1 Tax=Aeromicrobium sp. PE09-221 TaxID=1898043 RepID=UPI000B3E9251|nr:hypothetical protein [Aeromicrobium sp. PE09-221]OUZ08154.1 hypothetical protein BHE97_14570 [Aeromicrobium sp. PE09-221]